jgi:hypothetical protein
VDATHLAVAGPAVIVKTVRFAAELSQVLRRDSAMVLPHNP